MSRRLGTRPVRGKVSGPKVPRPTAYCQHRGGLSQVSLTHLTVILWMIVAITIISLACILPSHSSFTFTLTK